MHHYDCKLVSTVFVLRIFFLLFLVLFVIFCAFKKEWKCEYSIKKKTLYAPKRNILMVKVYAFSATKSRNGTT